MPHHWRLTCGHLLKRYAVSFLYIMRLEPATYGNHTCAGYTPIIFAICIEICQPVCQSMTQIWPYVHMFTCYTICFLWPYNFKPTTPINMHLRGEYSTALPPRSAPISAWPYDWEMLESIWQILWSISRESEKLFGEPCRCGNQEQDRAKTSKVDWKTSDHCPPRFWIRYCLEYQSLVTLNILKTFMSTN